MVNEQSSHVPCPFSQHIDMDVDSSMHTGHSRARRMLSDVLWTTSSGAGRGRLGHRLASAFILMQDKNPESPPPLTVARHTIGCVGDTADLVDNCTDPCRTYLGDGYGASMVVFAHGPFLAVDVVKF